MLARLLSHRFGRLKAAAWLSVGLVVLLLTSACVAIQPATAALPTVTPTARPAAAPVALPTPTPEPTITAASSITATSVLTSGAETTTTVLLTATVLMTTTTDPELTAADVVTATSSITVAAGEALSLGKPLAPTAINAPVELHFVDIDFTAPVEPMLWEVVRRDGVTATRWLLPKESAGWHPDSAQAGEPGNLIISGSQLAGAAVFAPLALGEVAVGQQVELLDAAGETWRYTVTQVSEPLALEGDPAATDALRAYLQPALGTAERRLTLLTGWPDFTTTHRLVVVAELAAP